MASVTVNGQSLMIGPQKDMFHFWYTINAQVCVTNRNDWWGMQRQKIQFKNGQVVSQDCIGK